MTPMIDMTFQLIAFFMVLINFQQTEQHEEIQLPMSELAKPPEKPLDYPITLNLTSDGRVIYAGQVMSTFDQLQPYLTRETEVLKLHKLAIGDATIIIRAHSAAKTGQVQELIQVCQRQQFEKFALRAKEDVK